MDTASGQMTFTVLRNGAPYGTFSSPMVGEHNLYNQVAIVAALDFNGFTADELSEGFYILRDTETPRDRWYGFRNHCHRRLCSSSNCD